MIQIFHWIFGRFLIKRMLCCVTPETQEKIAMDTMHGMDSGYEDSILFQKLSVDLPYRSIFLWRVKNEWQLEDKHVKRIYMRILDKLLNLLYSPLKTIEIHVKSGEIGGDFYLPHRYCVINAQKIGSHVSILQGVTIGKQKGLPTIGNNVVIYPNAVVVGNIMIDDHTAIGANAFVNYNVPSYSTVRAVVSEYTEYRERDGEKNG